GSGREAGLRSSNDSPTIRVLRLFRRLIRSLLPARSPHSHLRWSCLSLLSLSCRCPSADSMQHQVQGHNSYWCSARGCFRLSCGLLSSWSAGRAISFHRMLVARPTWRSKGTWPIIRWSPWPLSLSSLRLVRQRFGGSRSFISALLNYQDRKSVV